VLKFILFFEISYELYFIALTQHDKHILFAKLNCLYIPQILCTRSEVLPTSTDHFFFIDLIYILKKVINFNFLNYDFLI